MLAALGSLLFLVCVACARAADDLFDHELYRDALELALCARQLAGMRRADFYESSFHAPDGLLAGNFASLGNYHQCLAINQDFPDKNIQGKYCLIRAPLTPPTVRIPSLTSASGSENVTWTEVTLPEALTQKYAGQSMTLAVCVPKSCAVEAVLAPYTEHPVISFNYTEQYCRLPDDKPFVAADYVATIVFTVLGVLTLISTAYEVRHIFILKRDPGQTSALLRACSLYTNTRRLLTFDKPRALDCLDGIRALSILVIIIFHTFWHYFYAASNVANHFEVYQWLEEKRGTWMASGSIVVDSFFTLSGLLLVYTSAQKMKQRSLLKNLHWFYLNRYLRLFPLLACAVLLQASLIHQVADGPGWHYMAMQVNSCRRYWWSALFHVQNIINSRMCIPHAWYLSVDTQLHVLSPLVLYWVLGSRRAAWTTLTMTILASIAAAFVFCYLFIYGLPIVEFAQRKVTRDTLRILFNYYYTNTLVRSPPFLMGMLLGYILHVFRGHKIKLSQWVTITCHTLSLATFVYVIYIIHPSLQADWDNDFVNVLNNSFRRPAWSLALCWLIFACVHGYGGPVNWFLSLRLWKFVARISYAMYLFHFTLQDINVSAAVTPIYFSTDALFAAFASDLVYVVVLSTAMCVIVEEPAFTLHRMLLRGYSAPRKQSKDGSEYMSVAEEDIRERTNTTCT